MNKRAYPTPKDVVTDPYNMGQFLSTNPIAVLKTVADRNAMQLNLVFKPNLVEITFIKKDEYGKIKKNTVSWTNEQLESLTNEQVQACIFEVMSGGFNPYGFCEHRLGPTATSKGTRKLNH